jgi:hypothetical protein
LACIISGVESLREEAGKKLLEQNPSNEGLACIISDVESLREEAGKKLLEKNPDIYHLKLIIEKVESLRETAAKEYLLKSDYFSEINLEFILKNIPSLSEEVAKHIKNKFYKFTKRKCKLNFPYSYGEYQADEGFKIRNFIQRNIQFFNGKGAENLLRMKGIPWSTYSNKEDEYDYVFDSQDLEKIIEGKNKYENFLREMAANELISNRHCSKHDLEFIIKNVESLREDLGKKFLAIKNLTKEDFRFIIENVESLREESSRAFLREKEGDIDEEDLDFIARNTKSLQEEIDKIKKGGDIISRIKK